MPKDIPDEIARKLKRIDSYERLAWAGVRELKDELQAVCSRMNALIRGSASYEILSIRELHKLFWCLRFNDRDVLKFHITLGKVPSTVKPVVACCEVKEVAGSEGIKTVFHYVKVNDHGKWECVSEGGAETQAVTTQLLSELLTRFADAELRKYPD